MMLRTVKRSLFLFQQFLYFFVECMRAIFRRGHNFSEIFFQMEKVGFGSLFIVGLTGLFTGMVFALQTGSSLERFGVSYLVGKILSLSVIRELGPVLTAIVTAGRVGSGIAAEISSMVVTEQIDAIEAEGIDPVRRVVVPRLLACTFMLPMLTAIADAIALVGGWLVSTSTLGVSGSLYWTDAFDVLVPGDLAMGFLKPIFFGLVIGLCAAFYGLHSEKDARGVGRATNSTVVVATIMIISIDFVLSKIIILLFGL